VNNYKPLEREEANRRGERAGAEAALHVDKWLSRFIILPSPVIWLMGKWTFAGMKRKGYAHIEPESEFVQGFVTRFERERTIIFE